MHRIILAGIKHSGKSTIGWALSSQLGLFFADLDDLILRDSQKFETVRELYRTLGEEGFQMQEEQSLDHFLKVNSGKSFVLSLGGGTIENPKAIELMSRADCTALFLDANEKDLYDRIIRGGLPPFLEGKDPEKKFKKMYDKRSSLYKKWADIIVDTREKTPKEITDEIINDLL